MFLLKKFLVIAIATLDLLASMSYATTTLIVCGSHGTNGGGDDEPRQCMKVRPLKDQTLITSIPGATCPQIDPPSLQLDAGSRPGDSPSTAATSTKQKPKEIVVVGSKNVVQVEMVVNSETSVWWDHMQEQEDGCNDISDKRPPEKASLRLHRVDLLVVDDDDYDCEQFEREQEGGIIQIPEIDDEVLVSTSREIITDPHFQRVHVLLEQVLVKGIELNLAEEGSEITQTVSLTMKKISLYIRQQDESETDYLRRVFNRQYRG